MYPGDKNGMDTGVMEFASLKPYPQPHGVTTVAKAGATHQTDMEGRTKRKTRKRKPTEVYGKKKELYIEGEILV